MTQHKWHKEIKAWAMGCQIEACSTGIWFETDYPEWHSGDHQFRIKPQPKEKKYFYVYQLGFEYKFSPLKKELMQFSAGDRAGDFKYVGKIEVQDD